MVDTANPSSVNPHDKASHPPSAIAYRPDIDGLRCIAVMAVVIFHAGIAYVPGGFIGVDIFFVISGFLIGGQVFREVEAGTFSFIAFYARRLRRILPALFFVLLVMTVIGALIMTPAEFKEFGKEAVPTIFGLSNILYYLGGGYFATTADYNSLLMTWSLGIEEQFYVIFPIVMIALHRTRLSVLTTLVIFSVLSFAGSIVLTEYSQKAAFYLLPTRAWELGVGAILAIWLDKQGDQHFSRPLIEVASAIGLLLLAVGIFFHRSEIAFPGYYAAIPVAGTAMLIMARGSLINSALLSWRPVVFAGQVSYSWYLWHWPLFYYFRLLRDQGVAGPGPFALIALSFVLAVLTWRFVEQPFRRRLLPQLSVVKRYAAAAIVLAAGMFAIFAGDGLVWRLNSQSRAFAEDARISRQSPCLARYGEKDLSRLSTCVPALRPPEEARLLMLGDSHASSIAAGFEALAKRNALGFGELTKSSCLPLIGYAHPAPERPGHRDECLAFQKAAFDYIRQHPEIRTVILGGYWASGKASVAPVETPEGKSVPLAIALRKTVEKLQSLGRTVILVQDTPSFKFDPYARVIGGSMPIRGTLAGMGTKGAADIDASLAIPDPSRRMIADIARSRKIALVDPWLTLCRDLTCRFRSPDSLYYFDIQHLTRRGALAAVDPGIKAMP